MGVFQLKMNCEPSQRRLVPPNTVVSMASAMPVVEQATGTGVIDVMAFVSLIA